MSKKTGTIKPDSTQKEYGRRPYVSDLGYVDQMRRVTDKFLYDLMVVKQSEFKKPYMSDEGYDEMEYWLPPKPGFTDFDKDVPWADQTPDDSLPEHYYADPEFETGLPGFLGCDFYWPLTPRIAGPGEVVYGKIARRDDPVVSIETEGPITVLSTVDQLSKCVSNYDEGQFYSDECRVIAQLNDDFGEHVVANVILTTRTGRRCNSIVVLDPCKATTTLEWDDDESADTIARSSNVQIAVTGTDVGRPFSWSVSGTGFSLGSSATTGLTNTLYADATACGLATITVTDSCENSVTAEIVCTTGTWVVCDTATISGTCTGTGGQLINCAYKDTDAWNDNSGATWRACWDGAYITYPCAAGGNNPSVSCAAGSMSLAEMDPWVWEGGSTYSKTSVDLFGTTKSGGATVTFYYWGCS